MNIKNYIKASVIYIKDSASTLQEKNIHKKSLNYETIDEQNFLDHLVIVKTAKKFVQRKGLESYA